MSMTKSKVELKRVNLNMPVELYNKVCGYSEKLGINITAGIIVLLNQALSNNSMIELMPVMFSVMNEIKNGAISQDTISKIQMLSEQSSKNN